MTRSNDVNSFIEVMKHSMESQNDPMVGSFWYDPKDDELFGVSSNIASELRFYKSEQFNNEVRTGMKLHKDIWNKQSRRNHPGKFRGDYTLIPRGRVFEIKDKGFIVMTGSWINDYPTAKELILDEFQLPPNTEFQIDSHWDIGHGWSDEIM